MYVVRERPEHGVIKFPPIINISAKNILKLEMVPDSTQLLNKALRIQSHLDALPSKIPQPGSVTAFCLLVLKSVSAPKINPF